MERYIWNLIVLSVRTIIWLFMLAINTGPWLMEHMFLHIVFPVLGRERFLRMGKGSTIPLCMAFLGTLWGGVWLAFWGALGVPQLAGWGVFMGVVAGWKAGVYVADCIDQARQEALLEVSDSPAPTNVEERPFNSQAGATNVDGFRSSLPPEEDEAAPVERK